MARRNTSRSRESVKTILLIIALALVLAIAWFASRPGPELKTTLLKTSFNRLSSTVVNTTIPEPGLLRISIDPTVYLGNANVFSIELTSSEAIPLNDPPFELGSFFESIFNQKDTNNPEKLILSFVFPAGYFDTEERGVADLSFHTFDEGEFEITNIYFGSLAGNITASPFPPYQDYSIFIESSNIPFDANGAAKYAFGITPPPPAPLPKCSDQLDNDGDGLIDYPADPGCDNTLDNDELDPTGPPTLTLDLPSEYFTIIRKPDLTTEYLVILPPAQEQLTYEYHLQAQGGLNLDQYLWGVRGRIPDAAGSYDLFTSGLKFNTSGVVSGQPNDLKAGNFRYQFMVSDGEQIINFSAQIAVNDAFGNPIGLILESNIEGTEQSCEIDTICEAFFRATKGIAPYQYNFSGEVPDVDSFFQVHSGEMFYRFIPTEDMVGSYDLTVSVTDSSKLTETQEQTEDLPSSSIDYTLIIVEPEPEPEEEIEGGFKFAPERQCEFLDISTIDELFPYFQFTCRNGIMEGSEGQARAFDYINRAEAAKITNIIIASLEQAEATFANFASLPPTTSVNYDDVTVGDWYSVYVYFLFQEGVIIDNNVYRPADTLNVAEAMKLILEAYAELNPELRRDIDDIDVFEEWFDPYQTVASYVDATIAKRDPGLPAERALIAELLYLLNEAYPTDKFQ